MLFLGGAQWAITTIKQAKPLRESSASTRFESWFDLGEENSDVILLKWEISDLTVEPNEKGLNTDLIQLAVTTSQIV